jgi:hypothetical protein
MSIDIRPINILFDTNIPGKEIIPFTKSLLYNPVLKDIGNLNEYPYFTIDLLFPYSYLTSLPYEKQVSFFFNKLEMLKVLKIHNASYFKKNSYISEEPKIFTEREKKEMKEKEDLLKKDAYEKKKEYEIKEELKKLEERRNKLQIQIHREKEEEKIKKQQSNKSEKTNDTQLNDIIIQINDKRQQLTDISNKEFNKQGNQENNTPLTNDKNDNHDDENEYNDEKYLTIQNKNGNENVLTMLRLLFPTKYPIVGNIFSSFNSIILKRSEFKISFSDFLPSFLKNKLIEGNASYSYVKIDGKIYTIAQVIWLNDIYNHKEYSELIHKLINLNTWKKKALKNLNEEIEIKLNSFISQYSDAFDALEIRYIEDQLDKNKDKYNNNDENKKKKINGRYKYENDYISFEETIKNFIIAINDFNREINNLKDTDVEKKDAVDTNKKYESLSDSVKNLLEIYKSLIKFGANFFKTKEKYNTIINNASRDLENIRIKQYIKDKYISKPGINVNYENDDEKYSSVLKSKFKDYTNFANIIKKFKSPNKESSNLYLQKTFDEFLENREPYKGIFNFLLNPYYIHINPFEKIKKEDKNEQKEISNEEKHYHLRKNTGVTILPSTNEKEPGYEIYVQLNVIGGELNDTNISLIDCLYQSDSLGNKLEYLVNETLHNSWDINSTRLYVDIAQANGDKKLDKKMDDNENKNEDKNDDKKGDIKKDDKKQGGNTRKLRQQIINTRKNYKYM